MTTVVLADDHPIFRHGLRALLEKETGLNVVGESSDGMTTVELAESLQPDILVLDLKMPGFDGLEVLRHVQQCCPGTRVIVLSMYANDAYVLAALSMGAAAYIIKESTADDLVQAIHAVLAGHRYLSPILSDRVVEKYVEQSELAVHDPYDELTGRERQVIRLAAQGWTNAQIANRLYISARTVEWHRSRAMKKLRLSHQADLVKYASQRPDWPTDD